jgi:hypothetical protein
MRMSNMKKTGSFCWLVLVATLLAAFGCSHKPAYSEIDATKSTENRNQAVTPNNSNASTDAQQSSAAAPPGNQNSQASPPRATTSKLPSFMDPKTGAVVDLPSYPRAQRVSVQYGPMQGVDTFSAFLKTPDPMNKVAEFYERIIKENKWTVVDKVRDPEFSEWTLTKGSDNSAKVQIKKDQLSASLDIIIVRGEKLPGASN